MLPTVFWPAHFSDGSAVPPPTAPEAVKCVSPLCPRCGSGARDPKITCCHGRPHIGANGVSWPLPGKIDEKLKKTKTCKKSSFLRLCYTLWAIRAGRCRERRYTDHIFIQVGLYFRMHHFVVKLSKFSSPQTAKKN